MQDDLPDRPVEEFTIPNSFLDKLFEFTGDDPPVLNVIGKVPGLFDDSSFQVDVLFLADDASVSKGAGFIVQVNITLLGGELIRPHLYEQVAAGFH